MPSVDYSPRFLHKTYLERDRENPLRLGVYEAGAVVAPDSGELRVYNASNVLLAQNDTSADAGGFAIATVDPAQLTGQTLGAGWRVEWHLMMPDGLTHVFRNGAALCRVRLPQAASIADLLVWHADLNEYIPPTQTTWQPQGDMAWADILNWIESKGRRPFLVTDSSELRELHEAMWLERVGSALGADGDETNRWVRLEAKWSGRAEKIRDGLTFEYDENDEGRATQGGRASANPTLWLCQAGEDW